MGRALLGGIRASLKEAPERSVAPSPHKVRAVQEKTGSHQTLTLLAP